MAHTSVFINRFTILDAGMVLKFLNNRTVR